MSENKKENKITDGILKIPLFKKLKNIKHIEIIICIIFIGLLLLIYFYGFNNKTSSNQITEDSYTFTSSLNYAKDVENKLCKIISSLKGVGNVSVMVSVSESAELVIAKNEEEKNTSTNSNEKTVTKISNPIIVTENGESKPIILSEVLPKILGVVVVAGGADDVNVKLNIIKAIETITEISSENIQVFAGK